MCVCWSFLPLLGFVALQLPEFVLCSSNKSATTGNELILSVILPFDGTIWCQGHNILPAVEMAKDIINHPNSSLLRGYQLKVVYYNGQCSAHGGLHAFIETVHNSSQGQRVVGIVGPGCSSSAKPIGELAAYYYPLVTLSYGAETSDLSDTEQYPYFIRTAPRSGDIQLAWLAVVKHYGWRRFAVVVQSDYEGFSAGTLQQAVEDDSVLKWSEVTFINSFGSGKDWNTISIVDQIKNEDIRIIITLAIESDARSLICEASRQGMTGCCSGKHYVWILPGWFDVNWFDGGSCQLPSNNLTCTSNDIRDSIEGYLMVRDQFYTLAPKSSLVAGELTVGDWKSKYDSALQKYESELKEKGLLEESTTLNHGDYAPYVYDAIMTWAFALDQFFAEGNIPEFIGVGNASASARLKKIMSDNIEFYGISGLVKFSGNDRLSNFSVSNYYDGKFHQIGSYINSGKVESLDVQVNWGRCCSNVTVPVDRDPDSMENDDNCHGLSRLAAKLGGCAGAVALVSSAGFCAVFLVLIILFIIHHHRFAATKQRLQDLGLLQGNLKRTSALLTVDEYEISRTQLQLNRKLGEGCFGTVYGGEGIRVVPNEELTPIAVKTLRRETDAEEKVLFLEEAHIMKQLEHKNIVRLLGVCTKDEPICVVMELMVYGDLKSYLLSHRQCLCADDLYRIAVDVGEAVQYLHSKLYIHRLTKLGDFGLTRKVGDETDYYRYQRRGLLPVRWMSPESLNSGIFTFTSDVWSFGVLLYEVITVGGFPYQGYSNQEVVENVPKGLRISLPTSCPVEFRSLVKRCWLDDPKSRPSMSDILARLQTADCSCLFKPCTDAKPEIISASNDATFGQQDTSRRSSGTGSVGQTRSDNLRLLLLRRFSEATIVTKQVSIPERRLSCFSADVATMHQKSSCEVFNENDGTTV
ncbi:uncharacterized protein LOC134181999 isoform X2 [Corticium candelabrum]|uniref:uncharacterized protein LOC134181999 isoform X2 n=1 Tax=Corticium candelabrum TaxID=121492 RepID=UPI002E2717C0|nr:uncharacterized protein LOC134181999 isoform X2 [Corticium candelabrum]